MKELPMAEMPPETPTTPSEPEPEPEYGIVQWFNASKRIGAITRSDGSSLFIPPFGLADGQERLGNGQPVSFIVKTNSKGDHAVEVLALDADAFAKHDFVAQIAAELDETTLWAISQIRRIVYHVGKEIVRSVAAEAQRVEAAGGMLIPDGSRRRTLGGVFFTLIRSQLTPEQRLIIFPQVQRIKKVKPAQSDAAPVEPPPPPPPPPLTWADRLPLIAALRQHSGKVTSVKVTIIGRPSRIEEQPQFTVLTLAHQGPLPALPKGVPVPATVPTTTYAVYIGKKQWKQIAESIRNPEDMLIVEGTQIYDAQAQTISVFATKTTTKMIQQAMRQPKAPEA
jgi:cold shock CspA family protein